MGLLGVGKNLRRLMERLQEQLQLGGHLPVDVAQTLGKLRTLWGLLGYQQGQNFGTVLFDELERGMDLKI